MPSKNVYNQLKEEGLQPEKDHYLKYDSLASEDDLTALFEVLSSFKDKYGNPAVITANCVMTNPAFPKIKQDNYKKYYYEPFAETLERYPCHKNSFKLWKEGLHKRIFYPQFHGREHLNVSRWLKGLREGDPLLHKAFNHEMISISSIPGKMRSGYMESLDYFNEEEKKEKIQIIEEGLALFEKTFGFRSVSFIAPCYTWGIYLEKTLKNGGVLGIQGIANQKVPVLKNGDHFHRYKKHYLGQKNKNGQIYLVRNAFFEPSSGMNADYVSDCLRRIKIAFKWGKPAIIGSHRVNYIGFIDESNRERNLKLLKLLLGEITRIWPDVEFLDSSELTTAILNVR